MAAEEFIRRFLLHVLPPGFRRIRYYGFLGNRYQKEKLARCRQLLGMPAYEEGPAKGAAPDTSSWRAGFVAERLDKEEPEVLIL